MNPILIIEDEPALASALVAVCARLDREARACYSAQRGLEAAASSEFDLIVLDIGLPDMSGLEVLKKLRAHSPSLPVVIVTAHGSLDNAVAARKLGAASYLVKPLDLHEVQEALRTALAAPKVTTNVQTLPGSLLVGGTTALQRSFVDIAHACASDAPVLLTGPTGTGKTLTARIIHLNSARADAPFVALHCSALPETLLESELFGHEKNAFTGASTARSGHIDRAEGGTLFLDEIADISLAIQAKLLRFVEERAFHRVGGREDRQVDCRIITATNKDLRTEVTAGRFREDLYYRLHVLEIEMPALRERRGDIAALARYFLAQLVPDRSIEIPPETLRLLERHDWPGNVRELRNALEHAVAVAPATTLLPQHLPRHFTASTSSVPAAVFGSALHQWLSDQLSAGSNFDKIEQNLETLVLQDLLPRFHGKPTVMARELDINRVTLRRKFRKLPGGENETG